MENEAENSTQAQAIEPPDPDTELCEALRDFRGRRRAIGPVAVTSIVLILLLWSTYGMFYDPKEHGAIMGEDVRDRLVFLSYFFVLMAMWLVYFLSPIEKLTFFHVNTLRQMLNSMSVQWSNDTESFDAEEDYVLVTRAKAVSSIAMFSMLTAGAAVMLSRSLNELETLKSETMVGTYETFINYSAAGSAMAALVCFIIAVDSLDVLFNRFGRAQSMMRTHMIGYIYRSTRNIRYYGIMFLIWSICLSIGYVDSFLGAVTVATVICGGWSHWFPYPSVPERYRVDDNDCMSSDPAERNSQWPMILRTAFIVSAFVLPAIV